MVSCTKQGLKWCLWHCPSIIIIVSSSLVTIRWWMPIILFYKWFLQPTFRQFYHNFTNNISCPANLRHQLWLKGMQIVKYLWSQNLLTLSQDDISAWLRSWFRFTSFIGILAHDLGRGLQITEPRSSQVKKRKMENLKNEELELLRTSDFGAWNIISTNTRVDLFWLWV